MIRLAMLIDVQNELKYNKVQLLNLIDAAVAYLAESIPTYMHACLWQLRIIFHIPILLLTKILQYS